jgi:hypothetical protein
MKNCVGAVLRRGGPDYMLGVVHQFHLRGWHSSSLSKIFQKSASLVNAIPFSPWSRASKHRYSPKSHYLPSVIISCAYEA